MKLLISNTLVKWFKKLGFAGALRFKMLYWAYRLTGWHIRHREWDFVLDYLPPLAGWQKVSILDVGCAKSLFCHEIISRGYKLTGVDISIPEFVYPGYYIKADVRNKRINPEFDFITCISVLEHVEGESGQWLAMVNMVGGLKVGGRLILTIPTHEFAQGHPWHGFNYMDISKIIPVNAKIIEYTERMGQLCLCIVRLE